MNAIKRKSKINKISIKQWVLIMSVLLFLALEARTYISYYKVNVVEQILILCAVLVVICFIKKHMKINKLQYVVALTFCIFLLSNKLFTGDSSAFSMVLMVLVAIAFVFTQLLSFDEFVNYYTKAMVILCLYSVICTYTVIAFNDFFSAILPSFVHIGKNMNFIDAGLCFIHSPIYGVDYRNYSVFTEPGVYQFYINLAMILDIWCSKVDKYKYIRMLIYIVTLITTFSTTGMIVGLMIICAYLIQKRDVNNRKRNLKGPIIITILIAVGCYYIMPDFNILINHSTAKLAGGGSYSSRTGSLLAYLFAWLEKPIIGWGYTAGTTEVAQLYLFQYTEHNTNTIFSNFAFFGLLYGALYLILFSKFYFDIHAPIMTRIILFVAMLMCINNERFIDSTIVFIILFYSVLRRNHKEKLNEPKRNDKIHRVLR